MKRKLLPIGILILTISAFTLAEEGGGGGDPRCSIGTFSGIPEMDNGPKSCAHCLSDAPATSGNCGFYATGFGILCQTVVINDHYYLRHRPNPCNDALWPCQETNTSYSYTGIVTGPSCNNNPGSGG